MFHYPITTALFGTSLNLYILTAILILSWYRFFAEPMQLEDGDDQVYTDPFATNSGRESQKDDESEGGIRSEENVLGRRVE